MASGVEIISIETAVTQEEAAAGLKVALQMEIQEEVKGEGEGQEEGEGTQRALGALEFRTQEAENALKSWIYSKGRGLL